MNLAKITQNCRVSGTSQPKVGSMGMAYLQYINIHVLHTVGQSTDWLWKLGVCIHMYMYMYNILMLVPPTMYMYKCIYVHVDRIYDAKIKCINRHI